MGTVPNMSKGFLCGKVQTQCAVAAEALSVSGELVLRVSGDSMLPSVWPGDVPHDSARRDCRSQSGRVGVVYPGRGIHHPSRGRGRRREVADARRRARRGRPACSSASGTWQGRPDPPRTASVSSGGNIRPQPAIVGLLDPAVRSCQGSRPAIKRSSHALARLVRRA